MIWQMMMAMLHSNRQLRTERDGDTEKGCQKPALQQKTTDDDDDDDDDDGIMVSLPAVFWHCWLHGMKEIWLVKTLLVFWWWWSEWSFALEMGNQTKHTEL